MSWIEYVQQVSGEAGPAEISRRTGISAPSIGRWGRMQPSLDSVRSFAAGYSRPILEALVAAGVLTEEQARIERVETLVPMDVTSLTNEELISELLARLERGEHRGNTAPNTPGGVDITYPAHDIVVDFDPSVETPTEPSHELPTLAEGRKHRAARKRASKDPMTAAERLAAGIPLDVPLAAQKRDVNPGQAE